MPVRAAILSVFIALSISLALLSTARAEPVEANEQSEKSSFSSEKYGFSVSYPTSFQSVPSNTPAAPLVLRSEGGFPTITFTVHPGRFSVADVRDEHARMKRINEIVANYRSVGFTDAKLEGQEVLERTPTKEPALLVDLSYGRDGAPFRSRVIAIPGESIHYIVTFIDNASTFKSTVGALDPIIDSFDRKETLPAPPPKKLYPARARFAVILSGLLTFFAFGFIIWHHQRREQRRTNDQS